MRTKLTIFWAVFLIGAVLEALSAFAWHIIPLRGIFMALVTAVAAYLAWRDLRLLAAAVVLEGVVGSHGHLLFVTVGGHEITIRMVLFAALVIGFALKEARKFELARWKTLLLPLAAVVLACVWGVARGLMTDRGFGAVFADGNGYLFLLLIPIFLHLFRSKEDVRLLTQVFAGALFWLAVKSLVLLYLFSHKFNNDFLIATRIWQRQSWLTEITRLGNGGWVRVFAASDVFLIIGLFAADLMLFLHPRNRKVWAWAATVAAAFVLCLSRSFWLGAFGAAVLLAPVFFRVRLGGWRTVRTLFGRILLAGFIAILALFAIVRFPIPTPNLDGSASDAFGSRFSNDAAVSSRWKMLPPLEKGITAHPVLGSGFGAPITYRSDDPRIHELYPGGIITTAGIEWQYLEIWYKLGLLGLVAVFWLFWTVGRALFNALRRAEGEDRGLIFVLLLSFFAFVILNVFTPYLNHPLGWLYLTLLLTGAYSSVAPEKSA